MKYLKDKTLGTGRCRCAGFLMGVFLLSALFFCLPETVNAQEQVIRVGYVDTGGVMVDENGEFSGYLVDYLEEIAKYTDWEYDYVYGTWADNVEAIKKGDLDLLGLVRKNDDRMEYFLYSELALSNDYTAICAPMDADIYYREYEGMNGCRMGVVAETIHEDTLQEYLRTWHFDCEVVAFDTEPEMKEAMLAGEIDLMATGGLSYHPDVKLVDAFELTRTYFVTGINNKKLMEELDSAMQEVKIRDADLETELVEKYYGEGGIATNLYLTREEQEYIDSAAPIVVKGFADRRPLCYEENGVSQGIIVDYLDFLADVTGLKFIYESTDVRSLEIHSQRMSDEDYVIVCAGDSTFQSAEPMLATVPLFEPELVCVKASARAQEPLPTDAVFALTSEMAYLEEALTAAGGAYKVHYLEDARACMEAVISGEADMTIQDEYVASYLLQKPRYADWLTRCQGGKMVSGLSIYAPEEQGMLIQILNKAIDSLPKEQRLNVLSQFALQHSYKYAFGDMLYEYGLWIAALIGLVLIIVILAIIVRSRISKLSAQRRENLKLQEQVKLDELTGLYNRSHFLERAREFIDVSDELVCIVRLNIVNLKIINELYGPDKGDLVLCGVAEYLKKLSDEWDFVTGRFSGDRFYFCIKLLAFDSIEFKRQFTDLIPDMHIHVVYGVYPVGDQIDIPVNNMCDRANMACKSRFGTGTEYIHYYSDKARQNLLRDQEIEREQERAVEEGQFCIYIQPKYDVETEKIVGGEALVRWIHPEKGMISPGEFIPLFEKNGFIQELDYYVWEECCRFLREMKRKGIQTGPISVNVSRIHFYGYELVDKLKKLTEKYEILPGELILEVTETICAEGPEVIYEKCRELQQAGFQIAMDDFGSGYSSLNMLKEMPLESIKMDLRFLEDDHSEKGMYIVQTLIELAHNLKLEVVVEGVETERQKNFIRQIGNCSVQGYYFSKPVPCEVFEEMIKKE